MVTKTYLPICGIVVTVVTIVTVVTVVAVVTELKVVSDGKKKKITKNLFSPKIKLTKDYFTHTTFFN